jgi:hypothetical protein
MAIMEMDTTTAMENTAIIINLYIDKKREAKLASLFLRLI